MQDLAEIIPEQLAVSLYHALWGYIRHEKLPHIPLDRVSEIFEAATGAKFPIPYQLLRNGVMDHILSLSMPATGFIVVEPLLLSDSSDAAICALHRAKLDQLRQLRSVAPAQASVVGRPGSSEKEIQLLLRGLHRALQLRPFAFGLPPPELEASLSGLFFDTWQIPLLYNKIGFPSAIASVSAFPAVFQFIPDPPRMPRIEAVRNPDFTVGSLNFAPSSQPVTEKKRFWSLEVAKQIDQSRAQIVGLRAERVESLNDPERWQRLEAKIKAEEKRKSELEALLIP
jgi:hypothetical protein